MAGALSQEVHLVREVLEGVLAPQVATAVMFAALQRHGRDVPQSSEEVRSLVRGPMRDVLGSRVGESVRDETIARIERVLDGNAQASDFSLEIDIDVEEGEPSVTATMPIVWREPVSVVAVAQGRGFAQRLEASLGAARVLVTAASDVAALRHATFSKAPLLVFVDGSDPPDVDGVELARALHDLPENVVGVLWAAELPFVRALESALAAAGASPVSIDQRDGFEALLDLILSRYKTDTIPPTP